MGGREQGVVVRGREEVKVRVGKGEEGGGVSYEGGGVKVWERGGVVREEQAGGSRFQVRLESWRLTVVVAPGSPVPDLAVGAGAEKMPSEHQAVAEGPGAVGLAAQGLAGWPGAAAAGDDHGLGLAVVAHQGIPGRGIVPEPVAAGHDTSLHRTGGQGIAPGLPVGAVGAPLEHARPGLLGEVDRAGGTDGICGGRHFSCLLLVSKC